MARCFHGSLIHLIICVIILFTYDDIGVGRMREGPYRLITWLISGNNVIKKIKAIIYPWARRVV